MLRALFLRLCARSGRPGDHLRRDLRLWDSRTNKRKREKQREGKKRREKKETKREEERKKEPKKERRREKKINKRKEKKRKREKKRERSMPRKQRFSGLYFCARGCIMAVQPNSVPQVLPDAEEGRKSHNGDAREKSKDGKKKEYHARRVWRDPGSAGVFCFSRGKEGTGWSRRKTHKTYTTAR